jgi:hypothetical protein
MQASIGGKIAFGPNAGNYVTKIWTSIYIIRADMNGLNFTCEFIVALDFRLTRRAGVGPIPH